MTHEERSSTLRDQCCAAVVITSRMVHVPGALIRVCFRAPQRTQQLHEYISRAQIARLQQRLARRVLCQLEGACRAEGLVV